MHRVIPFTRPASASAAVFGGGSRLIEPWQRGARYLISHGNLQFVAFRDLANGSLGLRRLRVVELLLLCAGNGAQQVPVYDACVMLVQNMLGSLCAIERRWLNAEQHLSFFEGPRQTVQRRVGIACAREYASQSAGYGACGRGEEDHGDRPGSEEAHDRACGRADRREPSGHGGGACFKKGQFRIGQTFQPTSVNNDGATLFRRARSFELSDCGSYCTRIVE